MSDSLILPNYLVGMSIIDYRMDQVMDTHQTRKSSTVIVLPLHFPIHFLELPEGKVRIMNDNRNPWMNMINLAQSWELGEKMCDSL